jgi:hypothetical protein
MKIMIPFLVAALPAASLAQSPSGGDRWRMNATPQGGTPDDTVG